MRRKDLGVRIFAEIMAFSMAVGLCPPASAAYAAEGNDIAIVEEAPGQTSDVNGKTADHLEERYVLMNIPYADFYKAEVENDIQVDAFSSATLNKSRTNSPAMAEGSYHVDPKGSDITGITYPVKIGDGVSLEGYKKISGTDSVDITVTNRGQTSTTTYTGADALFEAPSYSYYELDGVPDYYKEVSIGADGKLIFGKDMSTRSTVNGVEAELMTETGYGDYQMNLDGLDLTDTKVFGIVLETKEGNGYGLRHVENIWRQTQLAWCTGFTEKVHNCPTSSAHYAKMMGETIQKVVYYTSKGIMEIPVNEYVPVRFSKDTYTLKVSNAPVTAGETAFELNGLPEGYGAQYSVDGLTVHISGSTLTFSPLNAGGQVEKGKYTLTVQDGNGHYAPLTTTFELYTEDMPAAYDPAKKALVAAKGYSMEAVTGDYIKNITSVEVDGTEYAASGRGAVAIVNADGTLKTDAGPLAGKESCAIKIAATGYLPLEFTYMETFAAIDTTALSKAIQAAGKLKKADYTAASWKAVETALKAAKNTLSDPETQAQTDEAAKKLNDAVKALKKAKPGTGTVYTYKNIKYQVTGSAAAKAQKAANRSVTSADVPAEITINGYKFKVTAVADNAFYGCKKLKRVRLGRNVTAIGNKAFAGCTALTSFTAASAKLSRIGKNTFYGNGKLAAVSLKTNKLTKANVGANAFKKIKAACTFKVPANKVAAYKAIFKAKGAGKKIKVEKL